VGITNAIYLWFLGSGRNEEEEVFAVNWSSSQESNNNNSQTYSVTSGLIALVTVGSGSHAIFDRFVWSLSACGCCLPGGLFENLCFRNCCKSLGYYIAVFLVVAALALATCIVVVRAGMEEGQTHVPFFQNGTMVDLEEIFNFDDLDVQDYSFVKGYAIEFAVSLFVYYPLFETILFSGILGCSRIPILGGRPYAMKQEAKMFSGSRSVSPAQHV